MNFFGRTDTNPRELFEGHKNSYLDAYFLALRDLVDRSPIIPTSARDDKKLDAFKLQELSSSLNRFHVSGSQDSIGDVLREKFEGIEEYDLLTRILVDGCNRKVKEELPGKVPLLNVDEPGTASHFQSFAEAMQHVIRFRLKKNH